MPKAKKKSEESKTNLEEIIQQRDEYLMGWKRAMADLDNYKKQVEREKELFVSLVRADLISKILPILNNWEIALKNIPDENKDSEWIKGIIAIKNQLDDYFRKEGVIRIETIGEKFDPNLHEAILEEETDSEESIILEEFEPGYKIGERVIKYPKVKVSKKK